MIGGAGSDVEVGAGRLDVSINIVPVKKSCVGIA